MKTAKREATERRHKTTLAYDEILNIENESDLKKAKLTLAEYHAIKGNLTAFAGCKPDAETFTICQGIADFFTRHKFHVAPHGIGYRITF